MFSFHPPWLMSSSDYTNLKFAYLELCSTLNLVPFSLDLAPFSLFYNLLFILNSLISNSHFFQTTFIFPCNLVHMIKETWDRKVWVSEFFSSFLFLFLSIFFSILLLFLKILAQVKKNTISVITDVCLHLFDWLYLIVNGTSLTILDC